MNAPKNLFLALLIASCAWHPLCLAQAGWTPEVRQLTVEASNLIRMGNPAAALEDLKPAVANCPESWDINFNIGIALEQLGRLDEAKEWFKKAYSIDPSRHLALLGLARILYDKKDYDDALPLLERLAAEHDDKETSYSTLLSLAKCYAETGKIDNFMRTMDRAFAIRGNDPSAWRFAAQEMDFVKAYKQATKYYEEYLRRFPNAPDAAAMSQRLNIVSYDDEEIEELKSIQDGFSLTHDTDDLKDFVIFLDPQHKGVSNEAVARVMLGLSEIPRTYRHQLEAAGYKVMVAPTVLDVMPQLAGVAPRGYQAGADWHNANGAFDRNKKMIVIGEFVKTEGQNGKVIEGHLDETVQHEFGHAYDMFLGMSKVGASPGDPFPEISHSKEFTDAYNVDVVKVPADLRQKLNYFLNPGDAGKEELFAQMFVLFFGHRPAPGSPSEYFQVAFPRTLAVLHEARTKDPDYNRLKGIYEAKLKENLLTPQQRVEELVKEDRD